MNHSSTRSPDLDWSQVKETVKLLTVSVALVKNSMTEGGRSVDTLTKSFTSMVAHLQAIDESLNSLASCQPQQQAIEHCSAARDKIQSSIVAFQFYDRLQQYLDHVTASLNGLALLIGDPQRLYNPLEWQKFQNEIRDRYTMEAEKIMFDAILKGKTMDEAVNLASQVEEEADDDIELF